MYVQTELKNDYSHYYNLFYQYVICTKKIFDPLLAEEIVTYTFMDILGKNDRLRNKYHMPYFLCLAIDKTCRSYTIITQTPIHIEEIDSFFNEPICNKKDDEEKIWRFIQGEVKRLPPQRKKIIIGLYWQGFSSQEVAEEMGLSRQTVINQKVRALKSLKEKLSRWLLL